jgi:hypothetical protein
MRHASCFLALVMAVGWASLAHAQSSVPAPTLPVPATQPPPPNRWTVAQIREAFQLADANGDGQLSRAEAQRLPIMPRSFEDTDLNKDGVLTLDEYQASFSRS